MYTNRCTTLPHDESSLLTVDDWRNAVVLGASVRALLLARVQRYSATPAAPAWLLRLEADALLPRLAQLEAIAAAARDRATLLHTHPLFGVPFAVKDNIDAQGLPTTAACPAWDTSPSTAPAWCKACSMPVQC